MSAVVAGGLVEVSAAGAFKSTMETIYPRLSCSSPPRAFARPQESASPRGWESTSLMQPSRWCL